jgi:hypothetical protein
MPRFSAVETSTRTLSSGISSRRLPAGLDELNQLPSGDRQTQSQQLRRIFRPRYGFIGTMISAFQRRRSLDYLHDH